MISYGNVPLHVPSFQEASWVESRISIRDAFGFFRPRWLSDPSLDPRSLFNWILSRPLKLNCYFDPWGASRFSYAMVLADAKMYTAITAQNASGQVLPFTIDDNLGGSISTPLFMLPPIPLSKIDTIPALPLYLLVLVDLRYYFWERAAAITITEGTTTWTGLYTSLATALNITLTADSIAAEYLLPSHGFVKNYQHLPLMLDCAAASVGQRIVRRLSGNFYARNASTANSLMIANANLYQKYAGSALDFGVVSA